jgi:hypothetical protein
MRHTRHFTDRVQNVHTCWVRHRIDIHKILAQSVNGCYGNGRFLNFPSNQSKSLGHIGNKIFGCCVFRYPNLKSFKFLLLYIYMNSPTHLYCHKFISQREYVFKTGRIFK